MSNKIAPFIKLKRGLRLTDSRPSPPFEPSGSPWKILIVDDEREVHSLTRMVLGDYCFNNRALEFLSAYSCQEAKSLINMFPEIAVILLDVVMETDDAGLRLAKYIRDELKNPFVRIILRTGQPGAAPEQSVIQNYDINDYKEKTELTSQKLSTAVTTALRSYRDLQMIERNRRGLERIIKVSKNLFELKSIEGFFSGMIEQVATILNLDSDRFAMEASGIYAQKQEGVFRVSAATGEFEGQLGRSIEDVLSSEELKLAQNGLSSTEDRAALFSSECYAGYFRTQNSTEHLLFLRGKKELTQFDQSLIKIFSNNLAIALDNNNLNQELINTQCEIIVTLGEVVDNRSKESANHVKRVAEYSYMLAKKRGMDPLDIQLIRLVSPMHDVGKIGIPDAILNRPGKLTPEEFETMKTHTEIGREILNNSTRTIMKAAKTVAHQHHEWWDGTGYPQGLSGENIHIFARITAIADVFDALLCRRCYKDPWPIGRIINLFEQNRGRQFDPRLVDVFLDNIEAFLQIHVDFPDR